MEKQDLTKEKTDLKTSSLEIGPVRLSDSAWAEAQRRAKVIQPLLNISKLTDKKRQSAAKDLGISKRTLSRLLERFKASGGLLTSLAPQPPNGGVGKARLNENVENFLQAVKLFESIIRKISDKQKNSLLIRVINVAESLRNYQNKNEIYKNKVKFEELLNI